MMSQEFKTSRLVRLQSGRSLGTCLDCKKIKSAFNMKLAYLRHLHPGKEGGGRGNRCLEEMTYKADACCHRSVVFACCPRFFEQQEVPRTVPEDLVESESVRLDSQH